jgi:SNF2 family DNA or RNA helicase
VVRKSECLDLPDMVYKEIEVELSSEQRRAYMEMKEDFLTTLKDAQGNAQTAVGRLAITKGLRLPADRIGVRHTRGLRRD